VIESLPARLLKVTVPDELVLPSYVFVSVAALSVTGRGVIVPVAEARVVV
jgi:hypothetical protein